jgi:hypothetical protein
VGFGKIVSLCKLYHRCDGTIAIARIFGDITLLITGSHPHAVITTPRIENKKFPVKFPVSREFDVGI